MHKHNLIIVARNKNNSEKNYEIEIKVIQCNLSVDKACEKIMNIVEEKN